MTHPLTHAPTPRRPRAQNALLSALLPALLPALLLAAALAPAPAAAAPTPKGAAPATKGAPPRDTLREETLEGGIHVHLKGKAGSTHIWTPPGYDYHTAGAVIYVHGYNSSADRAWREFQLPKQFSASRQNAMFIVPEAPKSKNDKVKWTALTDLRRHIIQHNVRVPGGHWVVVGHSGAYRTMTHWVDYSKVTEMILLDALYSGQEEFTQFVEHPKGKRLILISSDTSRASKRFIERFPYATLEPKMPDSYEGFSRRARRAKLLYIQSQFGHKAIVANRAVIPLLLRLTPLRLLP
ncbi:MAG: hypothetical protein FJ138_02470 [Deltaproteobacteria bacterium]|nr:hypothetical protein [Deltaproteobacteria bacterium]